MTTNFGEQLETVQAWKRSCWSGDLCPFRFLFAVYQGVSSVSREAGMAVLIIQGIKI